MRNTYDSKNTFHKTGLNANQESKERQTYTVNQKMMSFQKQPPNSQVSNTERMTKFIFQSLKKLSLNIDAKALVPSNLKPNQKTLLSTIAYLLTSFDNNFQESNLNIDMLPELFRSLGYPNNINKTYFQPVGAPHTWTQCLAMMEWLSQLAVFHFDIKNHLEEGGFDSDFIDIVIQAYVEQNPNLAKNYLQNQIGKRLAIIQSLKYTINTHNLSIENIKSAQKDLRTIQEQQRRLQLILLRQDQQLIQVKQQNIEMERKIKQQQGLKQEQRMIQKINEQEIKLLVNQIQNQELTVDEVERIRFQIRQYHEKITQLKRFYENQRLNLDKIDTNIIGSYMEFTQVLEGIRNKHKNHKYEIESRNVYFNIPESNLASFVDFLKERQDDCSEVKVQQMIGTKEIKEIKEKAEYLLNFVTKEFEKFEEERELINTENTVLHQECLDKDVKISELEMKLYDAKTYLSHIEQDSQKVQRSNRETLSCTKDLEKQIVEAEREQAKKIQDTNSLASFTKQLAAIRLRMQKDVDQSILRLIQILDDYKIESLEMLQSDFEYMQQRVDCEYNQDEHQQGNQNQGRGNSVETQNINIAKKNQDHFSQIREGLCNESQQMQVQKIMEDSIQKPRFNFSHESQYYGQLSDNKQSRNSAFDSPPDHRVNRLKTLGFGYHRH